MRTPAARNAHCPRIRAPLLAGWIPVLLLALTTIGAAGPAHAQSQSDDAQIDEVIEVKLASFRYFPDTLRIPSGETVRLVFHNEGSFAHEFMAGRTLSDDTIGYQTGLFEGVEVRKSKTAPSRDPEYRREGTSLTVQPDSSQSLTFKLPASKRGEWEMGCFLTNPALHYKAGMKGTVLVE